MRKAHLPRLGIVIIFSFPLIKFTGRNWIRECSGLRRQGILYLQLNLLHQIKPIHTPRQTAIVSLTSPVRPTKKTSGTSIISLVSYLRRTASLACSLSTKRMVDLFLRSRRLNWRGRVGSCRRYLSMLLCRKEDGCFLVWNW